MDVDTKRPPVPPRSRGSRIILFGAGIFAFAIFGLVIAFVVWRIYLRKELNGRLAAIHSAGLPTNWDELKKWPAEVPDSENGAFIYTNAIAHLVKDGVSDSYQFELPLRTDAISNEMWEVIRSAVSNNRAALDIAYTASSYSASRFPVDYSDGPVAKLPHLDGLKRIVKLLECEAVLKAKAGDLAGAARAVNMSIHVAQSLNNEPLLISQLSAEGYLARSCQSLERVLCCNQLNDESLRDLGQQLAAAEATNRMVLGLIGERALTGEFIRLAQDDVRKMIAISNKGASDEENTEIPRRNPGTGWRMIGFFERDRNFFLRAMETNLQIAATPLPASLSLTNESKRLEEQARKGFYIISSLMLPSFSHVEIRDATVHANLRTAIVAVAVERWRLAHHNTIPDSLDQLVPTFLPEVTVDPFDGHPLRFKKLNTGYIIYSVGPDQQDDNGKERPAHPNKLPPEQRNRFDIPFTVTR